MFFYNESEISKRVLVITIKDRELRKICSRLQHKLQENTNGAPIRLQAPIFFGALTNLEQKQEAGCWKLFRSGSWKSEANLFGFHIHGSTTYLFSYEIKLRTLKMKLVSLPKVCVNKREWECVKLSSMMCGAAEWTEKILYAKVLGYETRKIVNRSNCGCRSSIWGYINSRREVSAVSRHYSKVILDETGNEKLSMAEGGWVRWWSCWWWNYYRGLFSSWSCNAVRNEV